MSGLLPTLSAIYAGKTILLANKESLITSGYLFMKALSSSGAKILPIDSEHNAIFQVLPLNMQKNILQHVLEASWNLDTIIFINKETYIQKDRPF